MGTTRSIAQIWRGVTRAADREVCVAQLLAAIHKALVSSTTCKGAYLLSRPTDDADVELMVLTLFSGAAVASCDDDEAHYRVAAFDKGLPCILDRKVTVYEVSTDPGRTLAYAKLQRRFPLRLMAPR